tara:strand:- start:355 stop:576 length:222 start_codon:yes stop_codon:yes gene_type:complete
MLKPTEIKILDFIKEYQQKNKQSPTYKEITKVLNKTSLANTRRYLLDLKENGYIDFISASNRSIIILKSHKND